MRRLSSGSLQQTIMHGSLLLLGFTIFWNGFSEFRPSMDAMTYGVLAKNAAEHGFWHPLHYTFQSYSHGFFMHPPLAIWMQGFVFRLFGVSDFTSRLLPFANFFALVFLTYQIALRAPRWIRGFEADARSFAWFAALILLFSVRFTKYSVQYLMDPFMTTFVLASVLALLSHRAAFSAWSGVFAFLALCIKGLPVLALLFSVVFVLGIFREFKRVAWFLGLFLSVTAIALCFPVVREFCRLYWSQSVATRLMNPDFGGHLAPLKHLLRVYWPWLPFALAGSYFAVRMACQTRSWFLLLIGVTAASFVGGFVVSGNFLEHYAVPAYPFLAILAAFGILKTSRRLFLKCVDFLPRALIPLSIVFFSLAQVGWIHVNGSLYKDPLVSLFREARAIDRSCWKQSPADRDILMVDTSSTENYWFKLAAANWYFGPSRISGLDGRKPEEAVLTRSSVEEDRIAVRLSGGWTLFYPVGAAECEMR